MSSENKIDKINESENIRNEIIKNQYTYTCECGGKYTNSNKLIHNKTIRHQAYIVKICLERIEIQNEILNQEELYIS